MLASLLADRPIGFTAPERVTIASAMALLNRAMRMEVQVDEDGLTVAGSMGQQVAHPLIALALAHRAQAAKMIASLAQDGESAGGALARKRWAERLRGDPGLRAAGRR